MSLKDVRRRQFVMSVVGMGGLGMLAGCLGNEGEDEEDEEESPEPDPGLVINGRALSSAAPLELVDPGFDEPEGHAFGDPLVANVHWHDEEISHWHFMPLEVPLDGDRIVRARLVDTERRVLPLGENDEFQLRYRITEEDPAGFVEVGIEDSLVTFTGRQPGEGKIVFRLMRDDREVWSSVPADVLVIEE